MTKLILSLAGGTLLYVSLLGGLSLHFYYKGMKACQDEVAAGRIQAEQEAMETARELALVTNRSAERIAEKEKALYEQAKRQESHWKKLMASVPECRVPAAVGVQLDAASGVSPSTGVAPTPDPNPDDPALDAIIGCAETLDVVRTNYGICLVNSNRLLEAQEWYKGVRGEYERGVGLTR